MPIFYSASEGRSLGAGGNGWSPDKDKALGFAREQDARSFMEVHLPHMAPYCTIATHQWGE